MGHGADNATNTVPEINTTNVVYNTSVTSTEHTPDSTVISDILTKSYNTTASPITLSSKQTLPPTALSHKTTESSFVSSHNVTLPDVISTSQNVTVPLSYNTKSYVTSSLDESLPAITSAHIASESLSTHTMMAHHTATSVKPSSVDLPCATGDLLHYCNVSISRASDCYFHNFSRDCCHSCGQHFTGVPGCEFGDRSSWCSVFVSSYPSTCFTLQAVQSDCCLTCHRQATVIVTPKTAEVTSTKMPSKQTTGIPRTESTTESNWRKRLNATGVATMPQLSTEHMVNTSEQVSNYTPIYSGTVSYNATETPVTTSHNPTAMTLLHNSSSVTLQTSYHNFTISPVTMLPNSTALLGTSSHNATVAPLTSSQNSTQSLINYFNTSFTAVASSHNSTRAPVTSLSYVTSPITRGNIVSVPHGENETIEPDESATTEMTKTDSKTVDIVNSSEPSTEAMADANSLSVTQAVTSENVATIATSISTLDQLNVSQHDGNSPEVVISETAGFRCTHPDLSPHCNDSVRQPSDCYYHDRSRVCCQSCAPHYTNITGCEYGDRSGWCSSFVSAYPSTCVTRQTVRLECCLSCHNVLPTLTTEIPQDHNFNQDCAADHMDASWCSEYISENLGRCYGQQFRQTCCHLCQKYRTNSNLCPYGDEYLWCKGGRHCQSTEDIQSCCESCSIDFLN